MCWLALGILLALLPARGALAEPPAELLKKAVFLISRARFDESMALLNRARAATRDPALLGRIHLYLGINHSILGDNAKCDEEFREALRHNPQLKLDPRRIKASIVERFNAIRAALRGELRVAADIPGAEVLVDGKKVGTAPYSAPMPPGVYLVRVRDPRGGASHQQRVTITAGTPLQVNAKLAPGREPAPTPGRKRIWTWVAAGTAAVALGGAIGLSVSARADNDAYFEPATSAEDGASLESSGRAKALGSNILYGLAGAAAATSVILFFMEGRGAERQSAGVGLQVVPGPNPGVVFSGSF